MLRGRLTPMLLGAALALAAPASASAFAVGIVDASPANLATSINHPLWAGSGVNRIRVERARTLAPWNVALRAAGDPSRVAFERWLATAQARRIEPYVTFWQGYADDTQKCPVAGGIPRCRAPTAAQYTAAIRAFVSRYPAVKLVGAWNEPNFAKRPGDEGGGGRLYYTPGGRRLDDPSCARRTTDACGPLATATYWRILKAACGGYRRCKPIAGEFTSSFDGEAGAYVEAYKRFLRGHRPNTWAVHPYEDANRFQTRGVRSTPATDFILRHLRGSFATGDDNRRSEIWLSAVGVFWRGASLRVFGDASQRDAMAFVMRLPTRSDLGRSGRLTRLYVYNFQNPCCPRQDRGLLAPPPAPGQPAYDPPHRVREAYYKVCNHDGKPGRRAATCPAPSTVSTPPPAASPPAATPAPPAAAVPRDVCVGHPSDRSVACVRNAGRTVDACDRDPDGHRAYARVITDTSKPNFLSPFYDTNDSQPGCGNHNQSSPIRAVAVCVQTEGCSAFKPT